MLPAHDRQFALGLADERLAGDRHLAFIGHVEAGDDVEQGRLAATRWAHDGDELASADFEVGATQRTHRRGLLLECAEDLPNVDDDIVVDGAGVDHRLADGHDAASWLATEMVAFWFTDAILRGQTGVDRPLTR